MKFPLREVAQALGVAVEANTRVTGWSVDSRTLQPGDLFFALRGPNHDGHAYVDEVLRQGAAAVVVDRDARAAGEILRVENSLAVLQSLALWARRKWGGDVVGDHTVIFAGTGERLELTHRATSRTWMSLRPRGAQPRKAASICAPSRQVWQA